MIYSIASNSRRYFKNWMHIIAVSMTPLYMSQRSQWYCCACHSVVHDSAVVCISQWYHWHRLTCTADSTTPLWHAQRYQWHRVDYMALSITPLCNHDTAVTSDLLFGRLWLPYLWISIEKTYIGKMSCTISITFTHKQVTYLRIIFGTCGVIDTAVIKIGTSLSNFFANLKPYSKRP
jgi:hypothetical protein